MNLHKCNDCGKFFGSSRLVEIHACPKRPAEPEQDRIDESPHHPFWDPFEEYGIDTDALKEICAGRVAPTGVLLDVRRKLVDRYAVDLPPVSALFDLEDSDDFTSVPGDFDEDGLRIEPALTGT